jgi:predicted TIM-barrel fold metal-dependent hydrolase
MANLIWQAATEPPTPSLQPGEAIMIARREFVFGAAAAGVLMQPRLGYAKASQPATNVNFDIPAGACDCHTHIHGDPAKFPWFAGRTYTPEMALPEEMTTLHKALKIQRVVIVTPSVYGPDNSAAIYGMAARGNDARGVAVINDKTTDAELDRLASLGFKGDRALPRRRCPHEEPRLAYPAQHDTAGDCRDGSTSKVTPLWQVDDGLVLNLLPTWAPDPAVRKKILVDNPTRLYEF